MTKVKKTKVKPTKNEDYTITEFFEVMCAVALYGKLASRDQVVEILLKAREQDSLTK